VSGLSSDARGQAAIVLLAILLGLVIGAIVLGGVARGVSARGDRQRAADLAALAGAHAMRTAYPRLFEPPLLDGRPNPSHLERAAYLALGVRAAEETARRNGARDAAVAFPGADALAPTRVRVTVSDPIAVPGRHLVATRVVAEAELVPPGAIPLGASGVGAYRGPFAYRQGKPMRPDVAAAFDRLARAARSEAGLELSIASAWRSDGEQAELFATHPDPAWVARPGSSLHRLGTELDLGPPWAYAWLEANAKRFHFVQRYAWEPWHFGFVLNAGSTSVGYGASTSAGEGRGERRALPSFVPERFAPAILRASQRWNVSAALIAAQIYRESRFNPFARSPAGATGVAQFTPGTARSYGLANPADPSASIDAQSHYLRDLLREFGEVPLALAAYNAGPAAVRRYGGIPPFPETQQYVADILGLLHGAGDPAGAGATALEVRLVA
jgi:Transglycosylase SLT domain/D-alanyl-D-alanine carboxypeptidase